MTADELLALPDDGKRYELIRGELVMMEPAGSRHGIVALRLGTRLATHVAAHDLGVTFAAETGFVLESEPDTVRAPDAAFVRRERYEAIGDTPRYWPEAPALAIEVVSPDDRYSELHEKALFWLEHGTELVLVVDPRKQTITAYRSAHDIEVFGAGGTVDLGAVVDGFALAVDDAFS